MSGYKPVEAPKWRIGTLTRGRGRSWREQASSRLWRWFRDRAGISDLATSAQVGAITREAKVQSVEWLKALPPKVPGSFKVFPALCN